MQISNQFLNYARALLFGLGHDPNPANVSKLVQEQTHINAKAVKIGLEKNSYWVFDEESIYLLLEELLLTNPFALPSRYLALFLSPLDEKFVLRYEDLIQIAENFKQNPTPESLYTLRNIIEKDHIRIHIDELIENEYQDFDKAVESLCEVFENPVTSTVYRDNKYWIVKENNPMVLSGINGINHRDEVQEC